MVKTKAKRRATINIRIYQDTHELLKEAALKEGKSIVRIIYELALGLN